MKNTGLFLFGLAAGLAGVALWAASPTFVGFLILLAALALIMEDASS